MIAAVLLALLAQRPAPPRDAQAAADAAAEIRGVVVSDEEQSHPLNRVRVTLSGGALGMERTVLTGADGAFVLDGLPGGDYTVSAEKEAYLAASAAAARIIAGERRRVDLRLSRGGVIAGSVLDVAGQPAEGVSVLALRRRMGASGPEYREFGSAALPTDDRGRYRIFGLPPGDYIAAVQPSGGSLGFAPDERLRTTSASGVSERTFAFAHVFYPSVTDITRAARIRVGPGEERDGIDVQLQYVPLATIHGSVRAGADWRPAQVTLVRLDEVDGGDRTLGTAADADGAFSFDGIPPGHYRVLARVSRVLLPGQKPDIVIDAIEEHGTRVTLAVRLSGAVDLDIAGEDVTDLTIPLQQSLTVAGRIEFDGERPPAPLRQLQVGTPAVPALRAAGQNFPALIVTGDTFRAEAIEPGEYRFDAGRVARASSGEWWLASLVAGGVELLDAPVDIRQSLDGLVATITDRPSTLSGVVRAAGGDARAGVTVVAFSADPRTWFFHSRRIAAVETGDDGRYTIRNLPPGDYRVVAVIGLGDNEWFDPAVLEQLLPRAATVSIVDAGTAAVDLTIR